MTVTPRSNDGLSIIIITHNNEYIVRVVEAVLEQISPVDEVILVNDHSDERFLSGIPTHPSLKIVTPVMEGNRSHNRNIGAELSSRGILVFIDGDVLIQEGSLSCIRDTGKHTPLTFNVMAQSITLEQLCMLNQRTDIMNAVLNKRFEYLDHLDGMRDWRLDDSPYGPDMEDWCVFYTLFCSIPKHLFVQAGGFDESIHGWGCEDVDLGFRLKRMGANIHFIETIRAIHIPHPRNNYIQNLNGRRNLYHMLQRYRDIDIERVIAFGTSCMVRSALSNILEKCSSMDDTSIIPPDCDLILTFRSGNPVLIIRDKDRKTEWPSLGLAIPFENTHFHQAYISENYFLLPEGLYCRVLQELCRVSKYVITRCPDRKNRPTFDRWVHDSLKHAYCYTDIIHLSNQIRDFSFQNNGEYIEVSYQPGFDNSREPNMLNDRFDVPSITRVEQVEIQWHMNLNSKFRGHEDGPQAAVMSVGDVESVSRRRRRSRHLLATHASRLSTLDPRSSAIAASLPVLRNISTLENTSQALSTPSLRASKSIHPTSRTSLICSDQCSEKGLHPLPASATIEPSQQSNPMLEPLS